MHTPPNLNAWVKKISSQSQNKCEKKMPRNKEKTKCGLREKWTNKNTNYLSRINLFLLIARERLSNYVIQPLRICSIHVLIRSNDSGMSLMETCGISSIISIVNLFLIKSADLSIRYVLARNRLCITQRPGVYHRRMNCEFVNTNQLEFDDQPIDKIHSIERKESALNLNALAEKKNNTSNYITTIPSLI